MVYIALLVLGLTIGSFIAAFTYRVPRNIDFIYGRSFCDSCKQKLSWYDNIPVLSYLFYFGKSRCCSKKISPRYPAIELFTALGFLSIFYFSLSPIYYVLYIICLSILIIDFEYQIIPDELSWCLLFFSLFVTSNFIYSNLFSGFLFSFLLLLLFLLTKGRGMGLGDIKLAIPLGIVLGLEKGFYWITASFILGGIVASALLILKKANLKTKIAFGPFLIIAFWVVLFIYK